jgi:hypothetical protein
VNPVILNRPGRDFRKPHSAKKRDEVQPQTQTDTVPLNPFLAPLALGMESRHQGGVKPGAGFVPAPCSWQKR